MKTDVERRNFQGTNKQNNNEKKEQKDKWFLREAEIS